MTLRSVAPVDREIDAIVRAKHLPLASPTTHCTRYAGWSGFALKVEAIELMKRLPKRSKSSIAREFGVARETAKDWWDMTNRPRSFPPPEFVEFLACLVDAAACVREEKASVRRAS